jgi:hypothetical protein
MTETVTTAAGLRPEDGAGAFDPLFGRWRVRNRKLRDVLDPDCTEWVEFGATIEVQPIFGGLGNIDIGQFDYEVPFEGLTLRLYEPETGLWRIWWASTRQPGELGDPVLGRFSGGTGVFTAEEELAGRPAIVRFEWTGFAVGAPRWEQSFSYDGGQTWTTNWTNTWTRAD